MGWALPHRSLMKRMPHRLAHRPVCWRYRLSWAFPFPDDSSLCQVKKRNTNSEYTCSLTCTFSSPFKLFLWLFLVGCLHLNLYSMVKIDCGNNHDGLVEVSVSDTRKDCSALLLSLVRFWNRSGNGTGWGKCVFWNGVKVGQIGGVWGAYGLGVWKTGERRNWLIAFSSKL